jgi:hypothetical protein
VREAKTRFFVTLADKSQFTTLNPNNDSNTLLTGAVILYGQPTLAAHLLT